MTTVWLTDSHLAAKQFYQDLKTTLTHYERKEVSPSFLPQTTPVAPIDAGPPVLPPIVPDVPLLEACASFVTCQNDEDHNVLIAEDTTDPNISSIAVEQPVESGSTGEEVEKRPRSGELKDVFLHDLKAQLCRTTEEAPAFAIDFADCSMAFPFLYHCAIVRCLAAHPETPVRLLSFAAPIAKQEPPLSETTPMRPTSAAFKHLKEQAQLLKASITSLHLSPEKSTLASPPSPTSNSSTHWMATWKKSKAKTSEWAGGLGQTLRRTLKSAQHREPTWSEDVAQVSSAAFLADLVQLVRKTSTLDSLHLDDLSLLSDDDIASFFYQTASATRSIRQFSANRTSIGTRALQAMIDTRVAVQHLSLQGCPLLQPNSSETTRMVEKLTQLVRLAPKLVTLQLLPPQTAIEAQLALQQTARDIVNDLLQSVEDRMQAPKEGAVKERKFKNRMDTFRKGIQDRNVHDPLIKIVAGEQAVGGNQDASDSTDTSPSKVPLYKMMAQEREGQMSTTPQEAGRGPTSRFTVGAASDIGRRSEMQDAICVTTGIMKLPDADSSTIEPSQVMRDDWIAIFDGHGSRQAADYCSTNLHQFFAEEMCSLITKGLATDPAQCLVDTAKNAFEKCQKRLAAWSHNFGTTAVVAYISDAHLTIMNLGDSRAYLFVPDDLHLPYHVAPALRYSGPPASVEASEPKTSPDGILQLTTDHRPHNEYERALVSARGAAITNDRVAGQLSVTRALGDADLQRWLLTTPEVWVWDLWQEQDALATDGVAECALIVFGCDGIWEVMDGSQAAAIARKAWQNAGLTEKGTAIADRAAKQIVDEASKGGSQDNLTAVVLYLGQRGK